MLKLPKIAGSGAILLGLAVFIQASSAEARPRTFAMTCGAAQALVQDRGAVVFDTTFFTFGLFVKDRSFCQSTEKTKPRLGVTIDNPSCPIGFRCVEPIMEGNAAEEGAGPATQTQPDPEPEPEPEPESEPGPGDNPQ